MSRLPLSLSGMLYKVKWKGHCPHELYFYNIRGVHPTIESEAMHNIR